MARLVQVDRKVAVIPVTMFYNRIKRKSISETVTKDPTGFHSCQLRTEN